MLEYGSSESGAYDLQDRGRGHQAATRAADLCQGQFERGLRVLRCAASVVSSGLRSRLEANARTLRRRARTAESDKRETRAAAGAEKLSRRRSTERHARRGVTVWKCDAVIFLRAGECNPESFASDAIPEMVAAGEASGPVCDASRHVVATGSQVHPPPSKFRSIDT